VGPLNGTIRCSILWAAAAALAAVVVPGAQVRAEQAADARAIAIPLVQAAPPLDPNADRATWKDAATVALPWDVQHQRAASEPASAAIATDGTNVFVRFDVEQRETLLTQQHTNDVGDGTDDEVWVDLWPNGSSGFFYQFAATAIGTRYEYSSENTAYAPTWTAAGRPRSGGFTVTMKIPVAIMRGNGASAWKVQFVRIVRSTGERQIWSYAPSQPGNNADDVTYAGTLTGMASAPASRPKPASPPSRSHCAIRAPAAPASPWAGPPTQERASPPGR